MKEEEAVREEKEEKEDEDEESKESGENCCLTPCHWHLSHKPRP